MKKYIDADALIEQRPENLNPSHCDHDAAERNKGWNDCNSYWCELVENMPAADVEPVLRWISVDERLPEESKEVITVLHFLPNSEESYKALYINHIGSDGRWYFFPGAVTHWMPAPELPKMDGGSK